MLEGRLAGLAAAASLDLVSDAEVEQARRELAAVAPGRVQTENVRSFVQFAGQEQWL
jgi:hypothetical protein